MATNLPSSEYWKKRKLEIEAAGQKSALQLEYEIKKSAKQAQYQINDKIQNLYEKAAKDGVLNEVLLNTSLNGTQSATYKAELADYYSAMEGQTGNTISTKQLAKLKTQSKKLGITQLEQFNTNIDNLVANVSSELNTGLLNAKMNVYQDTYYASIYNVQHGTGVGVDFNKPGVQAIKSAAKQNWIGDNFSSSVWNNKTALVLSMDKIIKSGIVAGTSADNMAYQLQEAMYSGFGGNPTKLSDAQRLIRTEVSQIQNAAGIEAYMESNVDRYEYLATLDMRTSAICQSLDGKKFNVKDAQTGVNLPPMHPYCRSTTVPDFGDEDDTEDRVARDLETGKSFKLGKNMSYKQWAKEYTPAAYYNKVKNNLSKYEKFYAIPPLDFSSYDALGLYKLSMDSAKMAELAADYPPKDVLNEFVKQTEKQLGFTDTEALGAHMTKALADELGMANFAEMNDNPFLLDMLLNDVTQGEAINKVLSGQHVIDLEDTVSMGWLNMKDDILPSLTKNLPLYKQGIKDYIGDDVKLASLLNDYYLADDSYDTHKETFYHELFANKKTDSNYEAFYQTFKDEYNHKGITYKMYADTVKGQYSTFDEAKKAKAAELKAKKAEAKANKTATPTSSTTDYDALLKSDTNMGWTRDQADSKYRPWTSEVYKDLTATEKSALYQYTSASGSFNRPLAGYSGSWYNFEGVGKVSLGTEHTASRTRKAYSALEKSKLPETITVRRGGNTSEITSLDSGLIGVSISDILANKEKHVGSVVKVNNFLSTGIAVGSGFGGNVEYRIILPAGTKAQYVEPFSHYGGGYSGSKWDGDTNYTGYVGGEAEIIVQAGTSFIIKDVKKNIKDSSGLYIELIAMPESQDGKHLEKYED